MQKRLAVIAASAFLVLVGFLFVNARFTAWIESSAFQDLLNRETSKGLKFSASYSPLHRVGLLGLRTDSFTGSKGYKTIVSLQAHDISGTFNPLGIILRYWEIDSLHLKSGTVTLQKTEAAPGASKRAPWPPWWGLIWPYRVYLADVKVDDANILWKLKDKESGIYATQLEITPNWKDYEYDARGGDFKTPVTPPLKVVHAHVLIRRPRLYCSEFILDDDPAHPEEQLRMEGDAGLQDDRSMHLKIDLASMKVAPWLPEKYRAHLEGLASGHFDYTSSGTGLETAQADGELVVASGILRDLPAVRRFVKLTGSPDPGPMVLKTFRTDVHWKAGAISIENIDVECDRVFHVTGSLMIGTDKKLSGQIHLGLTDPYLNWLPTARTAIFTRDEGPYHLTTIQFSGTVQKPEQDLMPRINHEVAKSPTLELKLLLNQADTWFQWD